jgi:PAS domain S-box-containing protein
MNDPAAIKRMRSRRPGGLLLMALLLLLLLLAYQLWLSYRDHVNTAEINTRNLAAIFETRLDATLRRTDADLKALASDIPLAALNQKAVPRYEREVNAHLDGRLFNVEEMAGYRVHDANGDTLYTSDSARVQRVNIADRPYFRRVRDDPGAGLVFSDVITSRSTGRQVLVIARALRDERGKFMGIVHGLLELGYYRQQFQALDLGAHGVIALRRRDSHAQVVGWPDAAGDPGAPLAPDHPIVKRLASGERLLTLHYATPPENVERIVGIQAMANYPFYFAVGLGRDAVLAGWRTQALVVGVSTLLLLALVGALLARLGRMRVREAGILTNLAQSELQFSELAQMVPVGICHFDGSGRYTYVNDRHLALTGRRRDELLSSGWADFVHPDDRAKIQHEWERSGKPKGIFVCEYRLLRPDGRLTHVIGEVQTETDANGKVLGYIVAQTDITQRKQTEAELLVAKQQAERANMNKTRFLTAASHDLRQPIQAINLFIDALGRTDLSEEQKSISRFLSLSVHALGELLYALLDISKLDAGLIRPQMKDVPVEDVFAAVDAEFSTMARQRNLRFKLFYPFKSMRLLTDHGLLLSVLRNLIDNAFKYTELGGVLVGARKRAGRAIIQVWDTGIGIDAQYGNKVFEECFQVGNVLRDRTKGLGIGLSIARRMARLLDGEVSFRSRPGHGTVFEITLPLAEEPAALAKQMSPHEPADFAYAAAEDFACLRGWQVVVIEDDPMVAKSIELLLESMDIKVKAFASAELALANAQAIGADFYISDFCLPGADGLQCLDGIQRRSTRPINAVLLTGETAPGGVALAASSRWRVLFKPAELSELLAAMKDAQAAPLAAVAARR